MRSSITEAEHEKESKILSLNKRIEDMQKEINNSLDKASEAKRKSCTLENSLASLNFERENQQARILPSLFAIYRFVQDL